MATIRCKHPQLSIVFYPRATWFKDEKLYAKIVDTVTNAKPPRRRKPAAFQLAALDAVGAAVLATDALDARRGAWLAVLYETEGGEVRALDQWFPSRQRAEQAALCYRGSGWKTSGIQTDPELLPWRDRAVVLPAQIERAIMLVIPTLVAWAVKADARLRQRAARTACYAHEPDEPPAPLPAPAEPTGFPVTHVAKPDQAPLCGDHRRGDTYLAPPLFRRAQAVNTNYLCKDCADFLDEADAQAMKAKP